MDLFQKKSKLALVDSTETNFSLVRAVRSVMTAGNVNGQNPHRYLSGGLQNVVFTSSIHQIEHWLQETWVSINVSASQDEKRTLGNYQDFTNADRLLNQN